MTEEGRSSGFWTSLPGVLTGLATLLTALAAAYAVFRGPVSHDDEQTAQPTTAASTSAQPLALAEQPVATTSPQGEAAIAPLPSSPGCLPGYVWRRARPGDQTCVTPARGEAVAEENALAIDRREPEGGAYGTNTCVSGYVWRLAVEGDFVCVTPESRDQAERDNALADERSIQG